MVVDLGFGDAGKGTLTDHLARTRGAHTVVRFNGGAQAAHNVVTPDGRHHTFSHVGAASFVPGVETFLSRHMVVHPLALVVEARHLAQKGLPDVLSRVSVSEHARVTTPYAQAACRLREIARGAHRHGSCGVGVGETVRDAIALGDGAIVARDLSDDDALRDKLRRLQAHKHHELRDEIRALRGSPEAAGEIALLEGARTNDDFIAALAEFRARVRVVGDEHLRGLLARDGAVVFEGAQGVLLDEWRGFHPYTTWSTCTFDNALALLESSGYSGEIVRLGVLRTYATRHGAGPFPTEDVTLAPAVPEAHNGLGPWQGAFRVGHPDLVLWRYALACTRGVDALCATHTDRLAPRWKVCTRYQGQTDLPLGPFTDLAHQETLTQALFSAVPEYETVALGDAPEGAFCDYLSGALGAPVAITSHGPRADQKRERAPLGVPSRG
ncbi:MAG: adenylosuccinate synthetase [Tetrasphaera sp.]